MVSVLSPPQPHHLSGRSGGHLRHLCDVLRPGQLRPLFDPGEGDAGQAPAVCQRRQSFGLLDGQLPLGHGTRDLTSLWEADSNLACALVLCTRVDFLPLASSCPLLVLQLNYSISVAMVVEIFVFFGKKCYTSTTNLQPFIALLVLYG